MKLDLDELVRLAKAATPGPYTLVGEKDYEENGIDDFMVLAAQVGPDSSADYGDDIYICNVGSLSVKEIDEGTAAKQSLANGKFMAAMSPEVVLALIDELRVAEEVKNKANATALKLARELEAHEDRYGRGRSHD
jgi:hypothetical protein